MRSSDLLAKRIGFTKEILSSIGRSCWELTVSWVKGNKEMTMNIFSSRWRVLMFVAILPSLLAPNGRSQEMRGNIQGIVRDTSSALVPKATVTATNVASRVTINATSNEEGTYNLLFLLPGVYNLSASASGFKTVRRDNVELRIAERLQVDLTLEVGEVTEQVQVTAESPLLQTATSNIGQVIDSRRLAELPIPHGSPFSLLFLGPGTVPTSGYARTWQETSNLDGMSDFLSFNGAPASTSDWTIDGAPNVQSSHGIGPMNSPPSDLVQEFKMETAFDASVGHTSGTVVNVSLKTGGNQPHGTAYGFFRNPSWDANSFFANRAGQPKPTYASKRWGATLTGPVYIPKIYKGRDRTFFSYGYEGVHRSESYPFTSTVPDPKHATGDFSGLLAISPQYQIYDPATIKAEPGGRFSIQPFPGNIIPPARINPIAKSILTHFAKPNAPGRVDTVGNFDLQTISDPDIYFNHTGRIDHNLSEKHRLFGGLTVMRRRAGPYRNYYDDPAVANNFIGRTKQFTLDDVYTFSPSLVMNIRFGVSRFRSGHSPRALGFDPSQLGFSSEVVKSLSEQGPRFPRIAITGMMGLGSETETTLNTDIYYLYANLNKQYGRHNMKFGTDLRTNRGIVGGPGSKGGFFTFGTNFTRGPFDNSPSSPGGIGQGLATFLLGLPTTGLVDVNDSQAIQTKYGSFYLHDNWRVTQKLTVDLGLRWEYESPLTERFNRSVRGFDPNASQRLEAQARANYALNPDPAIPLDQLRVRGGLLFAGVGGQPRLLWDRSFNNFAPRLGFAYQVQQNAVIRGGFGIYPISIGQPTGNNAILTGFNQATELIPTLDNGQTFLATLANPFPNGLLRPRGASLGAETFLGRNILFYNPIPRTPYVMHWNLNTQTMLPGQLLLEIGYSGSKSVKLRVPRDINAVPNEYLSTSPLRDQNTINYLTANIPNPFAGSLPGTALNGATIPRSQLLRPYPHFTGVTMRDYQGYSWYHGLQVRLERRFSKGLTVLVGYGLTKKMDATEYLNPADPAPYRSISSIDRPHLITFSGLYELPIGRARAIGSDLGRVADAFLGGWQLGAVWQFNSGFPINFMGDVIFQGDLKDIPLSRSQRTAERWFNTEAGFERSSAKALQWNRRTFPLRFSGIRNELYNAWDISLLKNFKIHEQHQFQFRAEFYNAFNHPTSWFEPNSNPYSTAFGRVDSQYGLPRQIQLGVKYVF